MMLKILCRKTGPGFWLRSWRWRRPRKNPRAFPAVIKSPAKTKIRFKIIMKQLRRKILQKCCPSVTIIIIIAVPKNWRSCGESLKPRFKITARRRGTLPASREVVFGMYRILRRNQRFSMTPPAKFLLARSDQYFKIKHRSFK